MEIYCSVMLVQDEIEVCDIFYFGCYYGKVVFGMVIKCQMSLFQFGVIDRCSVF